MDSYAQMLSQLRKPSAADRFARLYGCREGEMCRQLTRYSRLVKAHEDFYHAQHEKLYLISAPGRTEIGGNHTDHNNGKVLAAAINLDIVACVSPRADRIACVHSQGFSPVEVDLSDLSVHEEEKGTSAALVRGVAQGFVQNGLPIGGFNAVMSSDVFSGSGLSSSAAFEVLICAVFDALYHGFSVDSTLRAQIAQQAENEYFGKPCGLLDQMASSTGGLVTVDFKDEPQIQPLSFSFRQAGYSLVVVNTGGSHENLTEEYASIKKEMQDVAACFGETVLRRVRPEQVKQNVSSLRQKCGDRAVLRALHFFEENERVKQQVSAIKNGDIKALLSSMNQSGQSSWMLLQNLYVGGSTHQPLCLALALAASLLGGDGASRVHGGGFAGTTLNVVPENKVEYFVKTMEKVFGDDSCAVLDVRPEGAALVFSLE